MNLDLTPWRDTCAACGAPIVWATTPGGRALPVNLSADQTRGSLLLTSVHGQLVAGLLRRNQAAGAREHGQPLHTVHRIDCPHPDTRRRRP